MSVQNNKSKDIAILIIPSKHKSFKQAYYGHKYDEKLHEIYFRN